MKEEVFTESYATRPPPALFRRVSWGAIFAGLFVTIVIQLMLTLLGMSIGAATINPTEERDPAAGLAVGSAIWLIVSGLISIFAGAFVAGRLSGGPRRTDGMLHGVVTWSVATFVMISTFASVTGAALGGVGSLVGEAMRGQQSQGGQSQFQSGEVTDAIRQAFPEAGPILPPTGRESGTGQSPGRLTELAAQDPELAAAMTRMQTQGGPEAAPAARDQVVSILTTKHAMDQQQATALITQWHQQFQQLRAQASQQARETGEQVAQGVAKGAMWAFVALLLGLVVSAWGGRVGTASLPPRFEERQIAEVTP